MSLHRVDAIDVAIRESTRLVSERVTASVPRRKRSPRPTRRPTKVRPKMIRVRRARRTSPKRRSYLSSKRSAT